MIMRKIASTQNPIIELKKDGDFFIYITVIAAIKTLTIKFKLNEEFDEESFNGNIYKTTFSLDGNTLTQDQKGDPPTHITREFSETECVMTVKKGDLIAKRWYRALN